MRGADVATDSPDPNDAEVQQHTGQVLSFERRRQPAAKTAANATHSGAAEPPDDLAQYEQDAPDDEEDQDDRHRMLMNLIALAVTALLVILGVWLADTIAALQRDQNCVLQGRGNCAPVEVPTQYR